MRRLSLTIVAALAAALALSACGSDSDSDSDSGGDDPTRTVVVTETVENAKPTRAPEPRLTPRRSETYRAPSEFSSYAGPSYSAEVPSGWVLEEDAVDHSGFVRSLWRDPSDPTSSVLIDSIDGETTSPEAKAASVIAATSQTAGYEQLSSEPATLAGLPGYRWDFLIGGDRRVDYFLNECATGIAVLGSATPSNFDALAPAFKRVADSVTATCANSPEPEPAVPPQPASCHPSYEPCLDPDAYDYDCEGGSGDGPEYAGFVRVNGPDDYGLDSDGDGIGCES